jgi:hypothetical protein
MPEQVNQDVEDLRLDVNRLATTTQLPTVRVNLAVTKDERHRGATKNDAIGRQQYIR